MFLRSWFLPAAIVARDIQLIYICLSNHFYRIFIFIKFAECFFSDLLGLNFWGPWSLESIEAAGQIKKIEPLKILIPPKFWKLNIENRKNGIYLFISSSIYTSIYLTIFWRPPAVGMCSKMENVWYLKSIYWSICLSIYLLIYLIIYLSMKLRSISWEIK